jgi:glycosyltransferase involved in cell wall biosynthesis
VAPAIPRLEIVIIGSVCSALGARVMPANVHLVGVLADAVKDDLLACADVALNPLFKGGGSSLKVPDFLASGLPMISTQTGVRGYSLRDGEHYVEATRATFVERTRALLDDPASRERIARNARRYAERTLDWTALGRRYRRAVNELIGRTPKPRVLVLTYRFADPPPGGAETFLVGMLKALHARGNLTLDVAACDIATIANKWHFSADYGRRRGRESVPDYVDNLFRFAPDAPRPDTFEHCRRLFRVWMGETRAQALLLLDDDRTLLLGGWNFPERHDGGIRRWTSAESHVQVPRAAAMLRIAGHAPAPVVVDMRRDGVTVASRRLSGRFEWEASIGTGGPVIALVVSHTRQAEGDPRELGIVVDALACGDGAGWHSIALDEDFEASARRTDGARWVRSLVAITDRRSDADDELFSLVRGPHSMGLARWLEQNLGSYDVVLAQGTPFSTPLLAFDVASRHGVPLVHLPHFHMEDRYYHWRSYYRMFRGAQRVIAAPESVKSAFFDVIGAPGVAIPGGGVDPDEFEPAALGKAEGAFRALHPGSTPFVLVLGRKTGAKHYRLVVEAVSALNADRHRLDVVLIGPDEDGVALTQPHTFAYGAQSREVVLGALKRAVCLVNMSESESFGIVLLESWLAGRPVIAQQRCAAFTDLVEPGVNGLLAATEPELVRAIDTYLTDEACAMRHALAGRAIAQAHAWSRIAEQIEANLMEATRGSARTAESGRDFQHEAGLL